MLSFVILDEEGLDHGYNIPFKIRLHVYTLQMLF